MRKTGNRLQHRLILKTILVFLASYLVFLLLWIQVKDSYGYGVTYLASKAITFAKDVRFQDMTAKEGIIEATFSARKEKGEILIDIPVKTSSYTFNAPLTLAMMAALYPFIKRKRRACGEALLILLFVHVLYVFSLEAKELTEVLIDGGLGASSGPGVAAYQFLWGFTDNMVIRFEPFLIGFYIFIRFRK
ncbi:MAG TPA: exosortase H-associated membrane protein [Thermodesulfovibrionales bacterium]|nr:exosortase H-associated membrane protein [Thermodesulfovibrionales bacterium]